MNRRKFFALMATLPVAPLAVRSHRMLELMRTPLTRQVQKMAFDLHARYWRSAETEMILLRPQKPWLTEEDSTEYWFDPKTERLHAAHWQRLPYSNPEG